MKKSIRGFTIVELLIVIVIIGILAAIVIVAYNGITTRATFTKLQTDLKSIDKVLGLYYANTGSYPVTGTTSSPGWRYSCETGMTSFIAGLSTYAPSLPQAPCNNASNHSDTWIYASDGVGYKLLQIRGSSSIEAQVPTALKDTRFSSSSITWGYWTSDWASI